MCNRINQKSDKLLANLHFSDADILQMKLVSAGVLFSRALAEYFVMENRCRRPVNVLNGALRSSAGFIGVRVMRDSALDFSGPELGTKRRFWQAVVLCVF